MAEGWIKLHRKLNDWEWRDKPLTFVLFIHILLLASHKTDRWRGVPVPCGSCVTGRKSLSKRTGLSEQQVRTALNHLKSTNEITIKSTKEYSIITVVNWKKYQDSNQQNPNDQPTSNQPLTTDKNVNNVKNEKEDKNKMGGVALKAQRVLEFRLDHWMQTEGIADIPKEWGDFSYNKLGMTVEEINLQWDKFVDYWKAAGGAKGKKADWKATWNNWCRNSIEFKQQRK